MRKIPDRFTEEIKMEIVSSYLSGKSRLKIAKEVGTKTETITAILEESKINLRPVISTKLSKEEELELLEKYNNKESSLKLTQEYGITAHTLLRIVRRNGGTVNPKGNRCIEFSSTDLEKIISFYKSGLSQYKIARFYGVHQTVISKVLSQNGISTRKRDGQHPSWKGGRTINGDGYVLVRITHDHKFSSMTTRMGYVLEHRLVMAEHLDRPLRKDETVHHINGNSQDNRIENLQLRQGRHGKGIKLKCLDCGSVNIKSEKLDE